MGLIEPSVVAAVKGAVLVGGSKVIPIVGVPAGVKLGDSTDVTANVVVVGGMDEGTGLGVMLAALLHDIENMTMTSKMKTSIDFLISVRAFIKIPLLVSYYFNDLPVTIGARAY